MVEEELQNHDTGQLFDSLKPDFSNQLRLTFELAPDSRASEIIRVDLENINEELIRYLAKHPELLHIIDPFKFEELVGGLFRSQGYEVFPTPKSRDGGFDFRAFYKDPTGTVCTLTLVECKRQRPERKVAVGVVRKLRGVLDTNGAGNGVIVTTSTFTSQTN
jgi:restriction endonuclease Mrr